MTVLASSEEVIILTPFLLLLLSSYHMTILSDGSSRPPREQGIGGEEARVFRVLSFHRLKLGSTWSSALLTRLIESFIQLPMPAILRTILLLALGSLLSPLFVPFGPLEAHHNALHLSSSTGLESSVCTLCHESSTNCCTADGSRSPSESADCHSLFSPLSPGSVGGICRPTAS